MITRVETRIPGLLLAMEYSEKLCADDEVEKSWVRFVLEYRDRRYPCGGLWMHPHTKSYGVDEFAADVELGVETLQLLSEVGAIRPRPPFERRPVYPWQSDAQREWDRTYAEAAEEAQQWALDIALSWGVLDSHEIWWAVFQAGGPIVAVDSAAVWARCSAANRLPIWQRIERLREGATPRHGDYYVARATPRLARDFRSRRTGYPPYRLVDGMILDLVEPDNAELRP